MRICSDVSDAFDDLGTISRAAFLSDVHLQRNDVRRADLFLRALRTLCESFPHVFILGDLFEFWAGPGHAEYADYRYVLAGMDEILDGSASVVFLHGNRDYFLGDRFPVGHNVTMQWHPFALRLDDHRVYVCHGDELLGRDKTYRFLRRMFRHRWVVRIYEVLPPGVAYYVASGYRGHSERSVRRKMKRAKRTLEITTEDLTEIFLRDVDVIIAGHLHRRALRYFARCRQGKAWSEVDRKEKADGVLYTLASWHHGAPVLLYEGGRFRFEDLSAGGQD